jgi:hypothetical protein
MSIIPKYSLYAKMSAYDFQKASDVSFDQICRKVYEHLQYQINICKIDIFDVTDVIFFYIPGQTLRRLTSEKKSYALHFGIERVYLLGQLLCFSSRLDLCVPEIVQELDTILDKSNVAASVVRRNSHIGC